MRSKFRLLLIVLLLFAIAPLALNHTPTLALDESPLYHNSRDLMYRNPFGAVTTETEVTLRLRTGANQIDAAVVRLYNFDTKAENYYPMSKVLTTPEGFDYWEYKLKTPARPTVLYYRFIIRKGTTVAYYEDDTKDDKGTYTIARKGGPGTGLPQSRDQSWQITVYTPDFTTPQWLHDAVIYQIFPDRFRNGDKSNDPKDGSQVFYGNLPLTFHKTWNEMMVDFLNDKTKNPNSDFFGGDLKGIQDKLPYLKSLGVSVIYLNPIFEARSNHRYDTADYKKIDPILGTMDDWHALVKAADVQGIRIILDGVFNHLSSDSAYFDHYHRFPGNDGACENVDSKYRQWFTFRPPTPAEKDALKLMGVSNACVDDGKGNTYYVSWAGFDSIPKLNNANEQVRQFIYGADDSVARYWLKNGASGWRLDVANEIDDGSSANPFWEGFRKSVRDAKPDAAIIAEIWNDVSPWVTGTQMDSTMNYRMAYAIERYTISKHYADNDVALEPAAPSDFDGAIQSMIEDYPPQSMQAMMNLLGSHDTTRLSFWAGDSQSQKFAAFLQFSMPGAPTIYYGDEIALKAPDINGQDDPYNRAPYPWPDESGNFYPPPDNDMLAYYTKLAKIRGEHPALRAPIYQTLLTDDTNGVYAFLRATPPDSPNAEIAVAVANRSSSDQMFSLDLPACLRNGNLQLTDAFDGGTLALADGKLNGTTKARTGALFTTQIGCPLNIPPKMVDTQTSPSAQVISANAGDGKVEINLPVRNALVKYDIYRSYFPDGGFVKINQQPVLDPVYVDTTVTNGNRYYYYVVRDSQSGVVMAAPGTLLTNARIMSMIASDDKQGDKITETLSAKGIDIQAIVDLDWKKAGNLIAQVALAIPGTDVKMITDWHNLEFFAADVPRYMGTLHPQQPGDYVAIARFSSDAGVNWIYSKPLPISVTAPASTSKPATPANLKAESGGMFNVQLTWDPVPGAYAYRVYRGGLSTRTAIAETTKPNFRDFDTVEGQEYKYSVSAIDESLNESEISKIAAASVVKQEAHVTFHVKVPDDTPASSPVYIAGDFSTKAYPQWDPGGMKMTDKGGNVWEITLNLSPGATAQYKYVRGAWDAVEKGRDCEEIANRTMLVKAGDSTVNDTVAKWRDVAKCG